MVLQKISFAASTVPSKANSMMAWTMLMASSLRLRPVMLVANFTTLKGLPLRSRIGL